jgi:hypothetical protein
MQIGLGLGGAELHAKDQGEAGGRNVQSEVDPALTIAATNTENCK